ncbi:Imm32 family immunity protein [Marinobacter sp. HN1S83]|uniref:Imm32 family immunity protein n=1 Tax=Marinobacter sp. HN1S83 TaxID=3382301 RepID=UPI00387AD7F8
MEDYMLTFELNIEDESQELAIHGSPDGLEALAHSLLRLVKNTKQGYFDHDHLMSESWGGTELTSEPQSEDAELLHHVKIYCYKGGKFQC